MPILFHAPFVDVILFWYNSATVYLWWGFFMLKTELPATQYLVLSWANEHSRWRTSSWVKPRFETNLTEADPPNSIMAMWPRLSRFRTSFSADPSVILSSDL